MAVSKRLRYEILRRDSHTCRYCGASAPDVPLRVDHVTPVALGGTDEPSNLVTSCEPCNSGKSSATVDSALVSDVSDDALRWAAAMTQAAESLREQETPKLKYRDAFLAEWNRWHIGKDDDKKVPLPEDWKQAMDRFRVAGIPTWMWADIVDAAMANQKVKPDNTFRYVCGIAWNKVTELQAEARRIVGARQPPAGTGIREAVVGAAITLWRHGVSDWEVPATAQQQEEFLRSLDAITEEDLLVPERIIQATQHAAYCGLSNIAEAVREMDRDTAWRAWISAWPTTWVSAGNSSDPWDGKFVGDPTNEQETWVKEQVDKLLDAGVYIARIMRAASHAGTHKSARIYSGLSEVELQTTGVSDWHSQALELWRSAFTASGMTEPTDDDRQKFFTGLRRITQDGNFYLADVYEAASAAGSYQDSDITTCLPRHLSAFEAAALPLGGES